VSTAECIRHQAYKAKQWLGSTALIMNNIAEYLSDVDNTLASARQLGDGSTAKPGLGWRQQ
jgi:hypothetical protein